MHSGQVKLIALSTWSQLEGCASAFVPLDASSSSSERPSQRVDRGPHRPTVVEPEKPFKQFFEVHAESVEKDATGWPFCADCG